ncbi:MAG: hypothetical protein ACHQWU_12370 [Gemmatimonadales bacterium]
MGCIARLGCLALLCVLAVAAWFTRDRWMPRRLQSSAAAVHAPVWEPLGEQSAARTRAALAKLSQPRGQAFQTLSAADVASYVFMQSVHPLPISPDSIQAMVDDDRLVVRTTVNAADLGGSGALGPIAAMLGDRAPLELSGTLRVVSRGVAEFQVLGVKVKELSLPRGMIPGLISRLDHAPRPAGIDADALPLPIPPYVGDIRVANGKITLYKTAG